MSIEEGVRVSRLEGGRENGRETEEWGEKEVNAKGGCKETTRVGVKVERYGYGGREGEEERMKKRRWRRERKRKGAGRLTVKD